jgi:hypothetical protein
VRIEHAGARIDGDRVFRQAPMRMVGLFANERLGLHVSLAAIKCPIAARTELQENREC